MENRQEPLETVYRSHNRKACSEHALVLEATGIKYSIRRENGEYNLLVAAQDVAPARAELEAYTHENLGWPGGAVEFPSRTGGWDPAMGYVVVLLLVAILQDQDVFGFDWFAAGKTHAELIRQGHWWRAVTALTLHADVPHLLANAVVGGVFGALAAQLLGSGLAWFSILVAGAAGNVVNAWIQSGRHTSIGASTAVFGALGIIAAYVWVRRRKTPTAPLVRWAPLVGGAILLGYLGAGGARTDVSAHVAGFGCGLLLGALYGRLGRRAALGPSAQSALGGVTLALLVLAWVLALVTLREA